MKKKISKEKEIFKTIFLGLLILLFAYCVSSHCFQFVLIQGDSMEPSFHNLQLVVMNKLNKDYSVDDVVVIRKKGLDNYIIKRIVACEGDSAVIQENKLYINGKPFERYANDSFGFAGLLGQQINLVNDEFLVIGDNVSVSRDSRYQEIGIIKREEIAGVVVDYRGD